MTCHASFHLPSVFFPDSSVCIDDAMAIVANVIEAFEKP
jgi:hypothetical protein